MAARIDIYGYDKRIAKEKQKLQQNLQVCESNKKYVFDFINYCSAVGLSKPRISFYFPRLHQLAKWLGRDFKEADKQDLQNLAALIESKPYSTQTKNIYRVTLKKFYKWLEGNGEELPEKLKWIKGSINSSSKLLPEELLTLEEVMSLIEHAQNPRDKAFIHVLYESGCRVTEIAGLKLRHVHFDDLGVRIAVDGKTGPRRVRLVAAMHHLSYWLENHPWKGNPDATLWPKLTTLSRGKNLSYANIRDLLLNAKERAQIKKAVNPHSFRHARATELAKHGLNESQLSAHFGWTMGTKMSKTYIHLSGKDTDDAILRTYGLAPKQEENNQTKCTRCQKLNLVTARFCQQCGMPLTTKAAIETENDKDKLLQKLQPLMQLLEKEEFRKQIKEKMNSKLSI